MKHPKSLIKSLFLTLIIGSSLFLYKSTSSQPKQKESSSQNQLLKAEITDAKFIVQGKLQLISEEVRDSSVLIIYDGTKVTQKNKLSNDSRFRFELEFNKNYIAEFSNPKCITKKIAINTMIPDTISIDFPPFSFIVSLQENYDDVDSQKENLVGEILYNPEIDNFDSKIFTK
ncbi:hypothetical protein ACUNWD_04765 [Sunxiuqinia sp. A32]|uniref:hypothetical protein n=1 Tax=Sunxiuqinia sp. A32 TaxID=3461496 RepID=UPI0040456E8F